MPTSTIPSTEEGGARPLDVPAPPSADVLGTEVSLTDYDGVMDWMDAMVSAGQCGYVCVAPVHTVMAAREDPELRAALRTASLTVPDGQPVVWALNAFGHGLEDRVYGPTLMARYCERSAKTGVRMFLYGGRDDAALDALERALASRYPGLSIVGRHVPPFRPLTTAEEDAVASEINATRADVVWVGIGVPKQEKWMATMRGRLDAPVLVGVGAAFDFHAGLVRQAPAPLQRAGLEWAFRLAMEPGRLWRRYARYNPRFVAGFVRQYARHLRARRGAAHRAGTRP
jgi:N-acetylglucosaminyldiphosphoundecaprenol N-acetyl-beta-D-mannosaminyltransferase